MSDPTAIICTAPVCLEDSREIPEIGSTGMRMGKQTFVDGVNLGWTHLDCEHVDGRTGAEQYFDERMEDPEYRAAYETERSTRSKPRRFTIECSVSDDTVTDLFEALLAVADLVDPGEVDASMVTLDIGNNENNE